ncbi:cys-tRNA(Pro)/Cys-tRNA(Cys) deacylase YbaK [bacterium BMS3Bbin02]|nr:cys-tRNA(Pro)/Cys-tRNA(Cys) deacylase YbaK [bacterium BMS3Bbin02]
MWRVRARTNATRVLDRMEVDYTVVEYDLSMENFSAEAVANELGLPAGQVFKTLCARSNTGACIFAVVPGGSELDLKKLARVAGFKKVELVAVRDVDQLTGYQRGSVTVMAAKKRFPVFVDDSVHAWGTIAVSAGLKGLQVMLSPDDYVRVTGATVAAIARPH